jgi:hypothetical protein
MSDDTKNPFGEKTFVMSKDDTPPPPPGSADKTVVFAKSNLQETFDARTVVRSSKPAPASLPDEAPPKLIPVELPPTPAVSAAVQLSEPEVVVEKPKLSKTERRVAREALDRRTRSYLMGFGAVCFIAAVVVVATLSAKPTDKAGIAVSEKSGARATSEKSDLASESETGPGFGSSPSRVGGGKSPTLGSYKTTTEVLNDFDRAAKKAQDHSIGF